jgi:signal recognition particle GTPase
MHENPGAYQESRNRIREKEEQEKRVREGERADFEISKEKLRKQKHLDVFMLKNRIETGNSLELLKQDLGEALKEGLISLETYEKSMEDVRDSERKERKIDESTRLMPLAQAKLTQFFEKAPLGENIVTDVLGFLYGFFVQGSAVLVILIWNLLVDLLKLPYDALQELRRIR